MTSRKQPEKPVAPVAGPPADSAPAESSRRAHGRAAATDRPGADDPESTAVRRQAFLTLHDPAETDGRDAEAAATDAAGDGPAGNVPAAPDADAADAEPPAPEATDTGALLAGATVEPGPPSRAAAHWWGLVLSLLLAPLAWYLVTDAGARLTLPAANPWDTGRLNPAALGELAAGLAVLAVVLLTARWSSVGVTLTGALVLLVGLPFLVLPAETREYVEPLVDQLRAFNDLGANAAHHAVADGATGRFVLYGLSLVLLGVVSHGARRKGRREEKARLDRARNRQVAARRLAENQRRSSEHHTATRAGSAGTPA